MSQEIKQRSMVAHRKVQFSDVRRRSDVVSVSQKTMVNNEKAEPAVDMETESDLMQEVVNSTVKFKKKSRKLPHVEFGLKRMALALVVAMVLMAGAIYVIDASTPDPSLKVIALQGGIEAVYPEYVPRGYVLSDITSENSKVIMNFKNVDEGAEYSLIEEVVGVDGEKTLNEYIKSTFGLDCTRIDEQDRIVYISNNGAAWVDGEILFKLEITSGSLTRKQIITIATMK
jgi:hypothetical protein